MIDHVCSNETTTMKNMRQRLMRKKKRVESVGLSKKGKFVYFQVAVAISVCLYWKVVTHTHNRTSV